MGIRLLQVQNILLNIYIKLSNDDTPNPYAYSWCCYALWYEKWIGQEYIYVPSVTSAYTDDTSVKVAKFHPNTIVHELQTTAKFYLLLPHHISI